jgi:tellurite resistance protein TehA-like permease
MKRSLVIVSLLAMATTANAQHRQIDHEVMRVVAVISVMVLIALFILTFLRYILDSRIKHRIIDKGISQDLASSLLANTKKDDKLQTLKWFCILAATGAGLMFVYYTLPLDIHSFAIMCFSISLGYLGYYFIMKQLGK